MVAKDVDRQVAGSKKSMTIRTFAKIDHRRLRAAAEPTVISGREANDTIGPPRVHTSPSPAVLQGNNLGSMSKAAAGVGVFRRRRKPPSPARCHKAAGGNARRPAAMWAALRSLGPLPEALLHSRTACLALVFCILLLLLVDVSCHI